MQPSMTSLSPVNTYGKTVHDKREDQAHGMAMDSALQSGHCDSSKTASKSARTRKKNTASLPNGQRTLKKNKKWRGRLTRKAVANATEKLTIKFQMLLPNKTCSNVFGKIADCRIKPIKNWLIRRFVWMHKINLQEAAKKRPEDYKSFNDFFTRKLDNDAREIAPEGKLASPVDGTVSQAGLIKEGKIIQAKEHDYSVDALLGGGDKHLAESFKDGSYANIYS